MIKPEKNIIYPCLVFLYIISIDEEVGDDGDFIIFYFYEKKIENIGEKNMGITRGKMRKILNLHKKWLNSGFDGERADLSNMDLSHIDIHNVDMRSAIMVHTNLSDAILCGASLSGILLNDAIMRGANLEGTNMTGADMEDTDMTGAKLAGANMSGVDMRGANMTGADMRYVNLRGANMTGIDMRHAVGNGREIKSLQIGNYTVVYTKIQLAIGCYQHSIASWFDNKYIKELDLDQGDLDLWNENKEFIKMLLERYPAV